MSKLIAVVVMVIALFGLVSTTSSAEAKAHDEMTYHAKPSARLQHAFMPHRDSVTGEMIARVNNWSGTRFEGWVCATEKAEGKSWHLGCLPVHLGNMEGMQFGVRTHYMGSSVHYTYKSTMYGYESKWMSVGSAY